jgi:DNA-binding NarL/FixJ family response regulator
VLSVTPIRVLVADDHALLRDGLVAAIHAQKDMILVAEASNGREAVECFHKHRPDVTVMDLQMPQMSGLDAIRAIRADCPTARILVLTTYKGDGQARAALEAGAVGYLLKSTIRKEFIDAIRSVHAGHRRIDVEVATEIAEHVAEDPLSAREIEVLQGLAAGNSNKAIARQLGISDETVKTHVTSILAKLHAKDRTDAVLIAIRRGLIVV